MVIYQSSLLLMAVFFFFCFQHHVSNNISNEVAEKGDIMNSNFATYGKLDLELIIREKMQKKVSLAEQIQAAKLIKGKLN